MSLASPSAVRTLLERLALQPSKALGQNFLIDANIVDIIVAAAGLTPGACVLEIGPGLGALTERLHAAGARIVAVEKDRRLAAHLRDMFAGARVRIIEADFLDVALEELLAREGITHMVSNLPYASGSRMLMDLSRSPRRPATMVVTVQDEVADRLAAPPGADAYGLLSVWTQQAYDVRLCHRISPACFLPRPRVWSAVVAMHARAPAAAAAPGVEAAFRDITRQAFQHRRKQLARSLAAGLSARCGAVAAELLAEVGVEPRARPEVVPPDVWWRLAARVAAAADGG